MYLGTTVRICDGSGVVSRAKTAQIWACLAIAPEDVDVATAELGKVDGPIAGAGAGGGQAVVRKRNCIADQDVETALADVPAQVGVLKTLCGISKGEVGPGRQAAQLDYLRWIDLTVVKNLWHIE